MVIWQCNSKFKDQTRCQTPHLTEDEVKAAFLRAVNSVIADRKEILKELRAVRDTLTGTEGLEKHITLCYNELSDSCNLIVENGDMK